MKFMLNIFLFCLFINYILSTLCDEYYNKEEISKKECLNAVPSEMDKAKGKECCYTTFLNENLRNIQTCGAIKKDKIIIKDQIEFMETTLLYKNVKIICFSNYLKNNFIFLTLFIFIL